LFVHDKFMERCEFAHVEFVWPKLRSFFDFIEEKRAVLRQYNSYFTIV
jgi:hypothetical protein